MSTRLVWCSATGAPIPTPALLTSTSSRPKRSRWRATTFWISSSEVRLAGDRLDLVAGVAQLLRPRPSSFSGRRAATVSPWPSSPSMCAIASPMPLEAPVTRAARSAIAAHATHWGVMGTPFTVALVLLAILLGAGFAFESNDTAPKPQGRAGDLPIATIGARVETIRRPAVPLRSRPAEVSPAQAQRDGPRGPRPLPTPPAGATPTRRCSSCSGCSSPDVDLRKVSATVFGQGVAGYYDPRTKRLRVVTRRADRATAC